MVKSVVVCISTPTHTNEQVPSSGNLGTFRSHITSKEISEQALS